MSLLVRSETLGLLVKTLTAHYDYSSNNTDTLPIPFQMQLSQKMKTFSRLFLAFSKSALSFEDFQKKKSFIAQVFSRLLTPKDAFT